MQTNSIQDKLNRQIKLELQGHELGRQRYLSRVQATYQNQGKDNNQLKPEVSLIHQYLPILTDAIQAKFDKPGRGSNRTEHIHGNLQILKPERLAWLTLRHLVNMTDRMEVTSNCIKLGKQIEADINYAWFQQKAPAYLSKVEQSIKSKHTGYRHLVLKNAARKVEIRNEDGEIEMKGIPTANWTSVEQQLCGKWLLEVVSQNTQLITIEELIVHKRNSAAKNGFIPSTALMILLNPKIREAIMKKHDALADLSPVILPSIVPPKPWTGLTGGCFHSIYGKLQAKMVRTHRKDILEYLKGQNFSRIHENLNRIQNTAYRINSRVLEVMDACYPLGIGVLPAPDPNKVEIDGRYPLTEPSPFSDKNLAKRKKEQDPQVLAWLKLRSRAYDKWHRDCSKRTALMWKLKIAKMFQDEPEIFFFWNTDYRGRIYPLQPYLNPQADDSGKALLEFATGKALGTEGVRWLQIHGANCFGKDKLPLADRVAWIKAHEDQIRESAENPLDGSRWWAEAEEPFQFLAFCFEYLGYLEHGPDHICHLPVTVDGTCSGLQHFSAMLRDEVGGKSVNLIPDDHKHDVYQEVADVVNEYLIADATDGNEFAKAWLKYGVDRKVVKRNVMTFCYGATRPGFVQQLIDDLETKPNGVDAFKACHYLGGINWKAVETVLVKAVEAMKYLQEIAHFVAKNGYDSRWTTPTGFRVVQDYLKTKTHRLDTWWGGIRYKPCLQVETDKKDTVGSKNAIAPNFVHSMDASHLILTTEKCAELGIVDFFYVHDSFGTHACDMPVLNKVLRETFVDMYSEDVLQKWTEEIRKHISADLRPDYDKIVKKHRYVMGELNLEEVKQSDYFFC